MFAPTNHIELQSIESPNLTERGIELFIARFDLLHPIVSGNKLFKLKYFFDGIDLTQKTVITKGGAYSNHLIATAYYCKENKLPCIGIVRGEAPKKWSKTLIHCREYGMHLHFVARTEFEHIDATFASKLFSLNETNSIFIPEGGYSEIGTAGAATMYEMINKNATTHIITAVGTATTLAGLATVVPQNVQVIGVPVLKNLSDIEHRIQYLTNGRTYYPPLIFDDYHFGGYAKKTDSLINFMNDFYNQYQIPTDFVYTGKMLYAVMDKIERDYFSEGSRIVCIHTGGLQGNLSLEKGTLNF